MRRSTAEPRYQLLCELVRERGWRIAVTTSHGRLDTLDVWKGKPGRSQLVAREAIITDLEGAAHACYTRLSGS